MTGLRDSVARHLDPDPVVPDGGRPAAVLVPIVGEEDPEVVFTLRTDTLPSHQGEVSFPGGSRHVEDDDLRATALRETEEELGIPPGAVEVLGALEPIHTFVSGFIVVPYVGLISERPLYRPNPHEIAEVIEAPLRDLLVLEREEELDFEGTIWTGHVFDHGEHRIWGATARILKGFLDILRKEGWT
jgi:8-oxo-dGTP pyrophosphatase MutT (NUDIX family)